MKSYPISSQDDQSNYDLTSMYGRKPTISGGQKNARKAVSVNPLNLTQEAHRMTKKDLVPPNNQYHMITSLNQFISNRFDFYAREYGEFFQIEITKFEDKLDALKREIQLNTLAEKRTQNSSHAVNNPGSKV